MPINKHLKKHYKGFKSISLPSNSYLFGGFRTEKSNIRKIKILITGPKKLKRDIATARWKHIVKDGLKIEVNKYRNKHAGAMLKLWQLWT